MRSLKFIIWLISRITRIVALWLPIPQDYDEQCPHLLTGYLLLMLTGLSHFFDFSAKGRKYSKILLTFLLG